MISKISVPLAIECVDEFGNNLGSAVYVKRVGNLVYYQYNGKQYTLNLGVLHAKSKTGVAV
jgi:hypothetical protein